MKKESLEQRMGKLLKNMPDENKTDYMVAFNFNHNTFFHKLIGKNVLERDMYIEPDDFFKGLVFVDYLTNALSGEEKVVDNLSYIYTEIKKKKKDAKLNLELILLETGLYVKEKDDFFKKEMNSIRKRYNNDSKVDFSSKDLKPADPYYESMGHMVCDLVGDENKEELENVESRNELKALVFSDCIYNHLSEEDAKKNIKEKIKKKDFLGASIAALEELTKINNDSVLGLLGEIDEENKSEADYEDDDIILTGGGVKSKKTAPKKLDLKGEARNIYETMKDKFPRVGELFIMHFSSKDPIYEETTSAYSSILCHLIGEKDTAKKMYNQIIEKKLMIGERTALLLDAVVGGRKKDKLPQEYTAAGKDYMSVESEATKGIICCLYGEDECAERIYDAINKKLQKEDGLYVYKDATVKWVTDINAMMGIFCHTLGKKDEAGEIYKKINEKIGKGNDGLYVSSSLKNARTYSWENAFIGVLCALLEGGELE